MTTKEKIYFILVMLWIFTAAIVGAYGSEFWIKLAVCVPLGITVIIISYELLNAK
jgi:hypothetical protein